MRTGYNLEVREVPVLSWTELCWEYNVGSVDVVQLDCEGKDCAIIRGLLTHCVQNPDAWPRAIFFEANHLTPQREIEDTIQALQKHGHTVRLRSRWTCAVARR